MRRILCMMVLLVLVGCGNSLDSNTPSQDVIFPFLAVNKDAEYMGDMGYIDITGKVVIEPSGVLAYPFSNGLALIQNADGYIYVDKEGNNVFNQVFRMAYPFHEERAVVMDDLGGHKIIDINGETIASLPSSDNMSIHYAGFSEGLMPIRYQVKQGEQVESVRYDFLDRDGSTKFSVNCQSADGFSEGYCAIQIDDGRLGYINTDGELALETSYLYDQFMGRNQTLSFAHSFSEGLAVISVQSESDTLYGYIDQNGEVVIPPTFKSAWPFSEGLAVAYTDEGAGYIDHTGAFVISPVFDMAESFSEGVACVIQLTEEMGKDRAGFIDKSGQLIIDYLYTDYYAAEPAYEVTNEKNSGLIQVRSYDEEWYGYINDKGDVIFKNDRI